MVNGASILCIVGGMNRKRDIPGDLAMRVYSSRLLGGDPALVLVGGGNTSVKVSEQTIFGEPEAILYVKGSGSGISGTIGVPGFAPVRMEHLLRLATLDQLSDLDMAAELRRATTNPSAPAPSVEAILRMRCCHSHLSITRPCRCADRPQ